MIFITIVILNHGFNKNTNQDSNSIQTMLFFQNFFKLDHFPKILF